MAPYFVSDERTQTESMFRASHPWFPLIVGLFVTVCIVCSMLLTLAMCCCCGNEKEKRMMQEKADAAIAPPPAPNVSVLVPGQAGMGSKSGGSSGQKMPTPAKRPYTPTGPVGAETMALANSRVFDK